MHPEIRIHKRREATLGTGGSFDRELRDLLWRRAKALLVIGLGVMGLLQLTQHVLAAEPPISTPLARWNGVLFGVHIGSLVIGGVMLRLLRRTARAAALQRFVAALLGFNIVLATFGQATCHPFEPPYFAAGLMLFLPACYIPWPARYQIGLGALAIAGYLACSVFTYRTYPELRAFCANLGGDATWRAVLAGGTVQLSIFTAVSALASHTLYGLRRRAHGAQRLGNYDIERELGRGGMGVVYLARHAMICRPTAIKVLESDAVARFEQEVRVSATLSHPNTIQIYDFGRTPDGVFYYAMEYLEGLDLQRFVERFGPLEPARAVFVLRQICDSLTEAHARGVVHRDIKPSNVFLTRRGGLCDFVKVLDFGLAKAWHVDGDPGLTKAGVVFGTPRYMPPEAVRGLPLDARADLYNVGCVAYCLLTGQPLFPHATGLELIAEHAKTMPLPPSQVTELPIPADLEAVVMRCLAKNPDDRFPDAAALAAALAAVAEAGRWDHACAGAWWAEHGLIVEPGPVPCAAT